MKDIPSFFIFLLGLGACAVPADSAGPILLEAVSSELPEFATTINAEQTELFFNRTNEDRSQMQLMVASATDQGWTQGQALGFSDGTYRDVDPFLSPDGNRLYFSSTRPLHDSLPGGDYNIWYTDRLPTGWSTPKSVGVPLNSDSTDIFMTMSNTGYAYVLSERNGQRKLWRSHYRKGHFSKPELLTLFLRGQPVYASNPCIAPDDSFLIVTAKDPNGEGGANLFVSYHQGETWGELINLGPTVNSRYTEFAPGLSKDGRWLYFTSERPGVVGEQPDGIRPPGDLYRVDLPKVLQELTN